MNELLQYLTNAIDDANPLLIFEIMRLPAGIELDLAVLSSLVEKATNLKELTVASLRETSTKARDALVDMAAQILAQSGPKMEGIYLSDLGNSAESGALLLNALYNNSSIINVVDLGLFQNNLWWQNTPGSFTGFGNVEKLQAFLKR